MFPAWSLESPWRSPVDDCRSRLIAEAINQADPDAAREAVPNPRRGAEGKG
jgi:hypothetical protein